MINSNHHACDDIMLMILYDVILNVKWFLHSIDSAVVQYEQFYDMEKTTMKRYAMQHIYLSTI